MRFKDIKKFPNIHYRADVGLDGLRYSLDHYVELGLEMEPIFQRGHVWTTRQQVAYMEYFLREPQSGREIYLNHPGWMSGFEGDFVLVDGLQRLTAAMAFLDDELPVFGSFYSKFEDKLGPISATFSINIAKLKTRADVLQWYLDFNSSGTIHSSDELERVKGLLRVELATERMGG